MSSRLFQEIREKRGLVYTVYSFNPIMPMAGYLGSMAGTGPSQVSELIPAICDELKRAAEDITDKEVSRARNQLKASVSDGVRELFAPLRNGSAPTANFQSPDPLAGNYREDRRG